jgi:16S rRNA (guanine527-N7)-methyltransferase
MSATAFDPESTRVREYLGAAYEGIHRFSEMLCEQGVARGLIGPRELPRLWDRHILNSAAVAPLLPRAGTLIDVGTGAGLPGVVLACMRPDLHVILLEPMERRVAWLREVVDALRLESAEVVRARAEDVRLDTPASAVTARAVAPLDRLAAWTLPLLATGGVLLAMKGSRAAEEVAAAERAIASLGGGEVRLVSVAAVEGVTPTTVVVVEKTRNVVPPPPITRRASRRVKRSV